MMRNPGAIARTARRFVEDVGGAVLVLPAVGVVVFLGVCALGIDMSHFYALRAQLQNSADAAALAGIRELPDENAARTAAIELAAANMPVADHGTVLATEDVDTGNWDSDTRTFTDGGAPLNAVRVVARRSQVNGNAAPTFFARIFGVDDVDISTVAIARTGGAPFCVLALSPTGTGIDISGSASIDIGCGMAANSSDSQALAISGSSTAIATSISVVGDYSNSGSSTLDPTPDTSQSPVTDPLAGLQVPGTPSGCSHNEKQVTSTETLSPGRYCNGLEIKGGADATLNPGVYIIDGGEPGLFFKGGATVTGTGVTFVLTDNAKLEIAGGSTVDLTAPASGEFAGVLVFQDPASPSGGDPNVINGDSSNTLAGAIYFPNQDLAISGSTGFSSACLTLIAVHIEISGDAVMGNECETAGTVSVGGGGGSGLAM